jgi:hypothetical protein
VRPDRTVDVAPERLAGWLDRFAAAHGPLHWDAAPETVVVVAADGAVARCTVPFPPLHPDPELHPELHPDPEPAFGGLIAHACAHRVVGVLFVRRGGFAVGVFDGDVLTASKVGARQVQGRSAAGGWSQQRFARRREQQARQAFDAAAGHAVRVWAPHAGRFDAVVTGGDRAAAADVLACVLADLTRDRGSGRLAEVPVVFLPGVPEPRQRVLLEAPRRYRAVRVAVTDPPATVPAEPFAGPDTDASGRRVTPSR